jgi:drug/metabolite transporter (DMT)-like permease
MSPHQRRPRTAGLFDIRRIIGALLGIYGAVLLVTGIVGTSSDEVDRAAGVNANLWSGVVMLLVAAFFAVWAHLRPTVVQHPHDEEQSEPPASSAGR